MLRRHHDVIVAVALLGSAGIRLWWDLTHPEHWDGTIINDPRVYGPVVAPLSVVVSIGMGYLCLAHWRRERLRPYRKRFNVLTQQAEEHLRQRRTSEATAAFQEAKDLYEKHRGRKFDMP
jgi:hypothetical protein